MQVKQLYLHKVMLIRQNIKESKNNRYRKTLYKGEVRRLQVSTKWEEQRNKYQKWACMKQGQRRRWTRPVGRRNITDGNE